MSDAYLVLENGKIFKGSLFGAFNEVMGEIVFYTGMTGYMETITSKSYYKQIVVQTFPEIGNYGVISSEAESGEPQIAALIVKHLCETPSNFQSEGTLNDYFIKNNLTGLYGVDTRALTKVIRENGSLSGKITLNPEKADFAKIKQYKLVNAVEDVSFKAFYYVKSKKNKFRVALIDFGVKESVKNELLKRDCDIFVFPHNSPADSIVKIEPDGILLSGGPSDPAENTEIVKNLKELIKYNIPIFGICLGHSLLALASGFSTEKLDYGHRGSNQAVKDLMNGKTYITSQSHGYAVTAKSINKKTAEQSFVNVNDGTNEGVNYKNIPAFGVQFHPSLETDFLYDKFVNMMEAQKNAVE